MCVAGEALIGRWTMGLGRWVTGVENEDQLVGWSWEAGAGRVRQGQEEAGLGVPGACHGSTNARGAAQVMQSAQCFFK